MKSRRAFSYARFSSAAQADGFSLVRQVEAAKAYCVGTTSSSRSGRSTTRASAAFTGPTPSLANWPSSSSW